MIAFKFVPEDGIDKHNNNQKYEIGKTYTYQGSDRDKIPVSSRLDYGFAWLEGSKPTDHYFEVKVLGKPRKSKVCSGLFFANKIKIIKEHKYEDILRYFQENSNKVCWEGISEQAQLTEQYMRENWSHLFYNSVWENQKVSESFMYEFWEYIHDEDFYSISWNQKLSEKFIHENRDKLDWPGICTVQDVSEKFYEEHMEYFDDLTWRFLFERTGGLSDSFRSKYSEHYVF